jgi:hypothetical protein
VLFSSTGGPWTSGAQYCGHEVGKSTISYFQPVEATLQAAGLQIWRTG